MVKIYHGSREIEPSAVEYEDGSVMVQYTGTDEVAIVSKKEISLEPVRESGIKSAPLRVTPMEKSVLVYGLDSYTRNLQEEARKRKNDPDFHLSATIVTFSEVESARQKLEELTF